MKKIRVGLVGAAFAAGLHIDAYSRCKDVSEVIAICDQNLDLAQDFAKKHDIGRVLDNVDELFKIPDIDVIDICLPNFLHCEIALKAFAAGKHVISEKPLGISVEEAQSMVAASEKAGKHLYYAEDWMFAPALIRAQEIIDQGAIGDLLFIKAKEAHNGSHSPFAQKIKFCGGGCMIHLGIHPLGFLHALKGMPTEVMAMTSGGLDKNFVHKGMEGEDWGTAMLRFADGSVGIAEANYVTTGGMVDVVEFCGSEGRLNVDLTMGSPLAAYSRPGFDYAVEKADTTKGWTRPSVDEKLMLGYVGEIRHFMTCIQEDKSAMKGLTGQDGLQVLKILAAVYESARTGCKVTPRG